MAVKTIAKPQLELTEPMDLIGTVQLGGRQTQPGYTTSTSPQPGYQFIARPTMGMQLTDLLGAGANDYILGLLPDLSPDVSLALWQIIRLAGRGMKVEVRKLDDSAEDEEGQQLADSILKSVNAAGGGDGGLIQTLTYSLYVRGEAALEVLPKVDGRGALLGVEDWFTVSTPTLWASRDAKDFQRIVWYQRQIVVTPQPTPVNSKNPPVAAGTAGYTRLNPNLVFVYGLDSAPDYPYGRSPIQPVLSHIMTDIQLLQDLGAWVHVGAWPHTVAYIDVEKLKAVSPAAVTADPLKWRQWISDAVADARSRISGRNPDDTISVPDFVRFEVLKGAAEGAQIAKDAIMMVERKIIRALKMLPALMGSNEGSTETHSTVQWEVFSATIEALQRGLAYILEKAVTVSLRLYGKAAIVNVSFEQVRASDRYRDAQSALMEMQAEITKRDEGFITQDEASIAVTGTPAIPEADRYQPPQPAPKLAGVAAASNVIIGDELATPQTLEGQAQNVKDNPQAAEKPARTRAAGKRSPSVAPVWKPIANTAHRKVSEYLQAQADDVCDAIDDGETDPDALIDESDDKELALLLAGVYLSAGNSAYHHASGKVGKTLTFAVTAPAVKSYMDTIPDRAKGINSTQRDGLKRTLENVPEGTPPADAVRAYRESRLAGDSDRIASSEAQYAFNQAALAAYEYSGVDIVDVFDGDFDNICADRDGQRVSIEQARDWAANTHPNCIISFDIPMPDGTIDDTNSIAED